MKTTRLLVAWMLVAIPLGWGVTRSIQKALPLFKTPASLQNQPSTKN
jgi:hypothetical protein